MYELSVIYGNQKSFGGKAKIVNSNEGIDLYSYDTLVARIKNKKAYVFNTQSQTTVKHIKEFLKQNGFVATTKKQIITDYQL